jgi:hypothetical protein
MTAFESAIHIQSRASVAAMPALAGIHGKLSQQHPCLPQLSQEGIGGASHVVRQDTQRSFGGFNRVAICGRIVVLKP